MIESLIILLFSSSLSFSSLSFHSTPLLPHTPFPSPHTFHHITARSSASTDRSYTGNRKESSKSLRKRVSLSNLGLDLTGILENNSEDSDSGFDVDVYEDDEDDSDRSRRSSGVLSDNEVSSMYVCVGREEGEGGCMCMCMCVCMCVYVCLCE